MNITTILPYFVLVAHLLALPAIVVIFYAIYVKQPILKRKIRSPFLLIISQLFHLVGITFGLSEHIENIWSSTSLLTSPIFPYFYVSILLYKSLFCIAIEPRSGLYFSNLINSALVFLFVFTVVLFLIPEGVLNVWLFLLPISLFVFLIFYFRSFTVLPRIYLNLFIIFTFLSPLVFYTRPYFKEQEIVHFFEAILHVIALLMLAKAIYGVVDKKN